MTCSTAEQLVLPDLEPIRFLPAQDALNNLKRCLAVKMVDQSAADVLDHLLVLGTAETGSDYLQSVVEALDGMFHATSVFVAFRPELATNRVKVLAAYKDGVDRVLWDYSLDGNPCHLVYDGETTLIPCRLAEHFPNKRDSGYQSFIGVPLLAANQDVLGHIAVYDAAPVAEPNFRTAVVQVLAARAACELERQHSLSELQRQATTDALTGLLNRHAFDAVAEAKFHAALRCTEPLFLVAFDLDEFKTVNDSHGHAAGDAVLVEFAHALSREFSRRSDVLARLGGDEFAVLINATNWSDVVAGATRIQQKFAATPVPTDREEVHGACSFGIAEVRRDDDSLAHMSARADADLYAAKARRPTALNPG